MSNKQLLINPQMIEDKVSGIKNAIEDIRQELYIRNKLLGKAVQLLRVCGYISGVLDYTLDLNDPWLRGVLDTIHTADFIGEADLWKHHIAITKRRI